MWQACFQEILQGPPVSVSGLCPSMPAFSSAWERGGLQGHAGVNRMPPSLGSCLASTPTHGCSHLLLGVSVRATEGQAVTLQVIWELLL